MNFSNSKNKFQMPDFPGLVIALLAFSFVLSSCQKEYFDKTKVKDPVWNPTWSVPVIHSTVTVPDVLDKFDGEEIVVINADGLLALKYYDEIFSVSAPQLVGLPDQNHSESASLSPADLTNLANGNGITVTNVVNYQFMTPSGEQLKTITFKNGELQFTINNQLGYGGTLNISIPSLRDAGGATYNRTINFSGPASNVTTLISLAGWTMDLTKNNTTTNELDVTLAATFNPNGSQMTNSFTIDQDLRNMEFSLITGDIGQHILTTGLDSVRIRLYENNTGGTITWKDPRIRAIFTNTYGLEMEITASPFSTINRQNVVLPINGFNFPLTIPSDNTPNGSAVRSFLLDKNTPGGNLISVIASSPTRIVYNLNPYVLNPGAGPYSNWISDTSRLKLDLEVELPFDGRADDFTQIDTTMLDIFPLSDDIEEIVSIMIRVTVDNGMPIEGRAQGYFLDSNYNVIDSIFQSGQEFVILPAVPVLNAQGQMRVPQDQKVRKMTDILIDRDLVNKLENQGMKYIVSKAIADTYENASTDVQIYKDYTMDLRIGIQTEFKYKISLDSLRNN